MRKLFILTVPFLTAILLYLGLSELERPAQPLGSEAVPASPAYEAYSEGLNTVRFNDEGAIDYTLQAIRQLHFANGESEFEQPLLRLYDQNSGNWNIVADSGTISGNPADASGNQLIDLRGNVQVFRLDQLGERLQLNTEQLTVSPGDETLHTESPVSVTSNAISQTAIGMHANLELEEIVFTRDIQGRYESPVN